MDKIFEKKDFAKCPAIGPLGYYGYGEMFHVEVHYQSEYPPFIHTFYQELNTHNNRTFKHKWIACMNMNVKESIQKAEKLIEKYRER